MLEVTWALKVTVDVNTKIADYPFYDVRDHFLVISLISFLLVTRIL